jgi:pre-mRNA 3'-end-processing factor FIP1
MSNIEEDDDDFLYGDDSAPVTSKEAEPQTITQDVPQSKEDGKDDNEEGDEDEGEEEEGSDEDSDSDIEFIIGSEETKTEVGPASEAATTAAAVADAQTASGVVPEAIGETAIETDKPEPQSTSTDATIARVSGVDINKVGEYNGIPVTAINLQDLKEKPWRQPGADVSEYFNFGFNEFTWMLYCSKQDKLRSQFNPQKAMMEFMPMAMMGGMPGMPLPNMMPGFPMMPGQVQPPQPPVQQQQQMPPQPPSQNPQESSRTGTPSGPSGQLPTGPSRMNGDFPKGPSGRNDRKRKR